MCHLRWVTVKYVWFIHLCLYTERSTQGDLEAVVCEHKTLEITCSGRQQIHISSAEYGRTMPGTTHCRLPLFDWKTDCYSKETTLGITKEECEGFPSCTLYANNREYGDPCFGTFKYLKVCVHSLIFKEKLCNLQRVKHCQKSSVKLFLPCIDYAFQNVVIKLVNNYLKLTVSAKAKIQKSKWFCI